jgi:hypothetical protein
MVEKILNRLKEGTKRYKIKTHPVTIDSEPTKLAQPGYPVSLR